MEGTRDMAVWLLPASVALHFSKADPQSLHFPLFLGLRARPTDLSFCGSGSAGFRIDLVAGGTRRGYGRGNGVIRRRELNAIAASLLSAIERFVRQVEQGFGVKGICRFADADAEAHRNRNLFSVVDNRFRFERFPNPFCNGHCAGSVGGRKDDQEFLTAIAPERVVGTYAALDALGGFGEDSVTSEMAMGIVDVFEVIDIEQDDREGVAFARLAGAFAAKCVEAHAAVGDAGESVVRGLIEELLARK